MWLGFVVCTFVLDSDSTVEYYVGGFVGGGFFGFGGFSSVWEKRNSIFGLGAFDFQ